MDGLPDGRAALGRLLGVGWIPKMFGYNSNAFLEQFGTDGAILFEKLPSVAFLAILNNHLGGSRLHWPLNIRVHMAGSTAPNRPPAAAQDAKLAQEVAELLGIGLGPR